MVRFTFVSETAAIAAARLLAGGDRGVAAEAARGAPTPDGTVPATPSTPPAEKRRRFRRRDVRRAPRRAEYVPRLSSAARYRPGTMPAGSAAPRKTKLNFDFILFVFMNARD